MLPAVEIERDFYELMMQSQYWSREELMGYQFHQLAKLLMHAQRNVPFYKNRLNAVLNSDGTFNWHRWLDIPTVTRKDLLEHHDAMQAINMHPAYGITAQFNSSGTTGIPVTTTHNAYASWVNRAVVMRAYQWHNIDWNKNLCELPLQNIPGEACVEDAKYAGHWGPAWEPNKKGQIWHFDRAAPPGKIFEFMLHHNIAYISSRPKTVHMLAHAAQNMGAQIKLDAIMSMGTAVGTDDRKICKDVFDARIVGLYSSKEGHKMAYQCPTGTHYHAMSEASLLEILNDNNEPCKIGEVGRVVITPFFSFAQPLIRYEQGDLAEAGAPCACGRVLPVINNISGRVMHMFRFPDGSKIAPVLPDYCREALGNITWQVAQTGPLTIELRYHRPQELEENAKLYIAGIIKKTMYADVNVLFKRLDHIPLNANGKFLEYVCELPAEDA